jgi:large subunit ribosomal protein L16
MGTGKAEVDYWAARIKPGTMLFEIAGVTEAVAKKVMIRVAMKMPVKTRLVSRRVAV